jgi:uncharacterized membrane protein YqjE
MPYTNDVREGSGLFNSVRNLTCTLIGVLQTRLEIIAGEIEEQQLQQFQLLLLGATAGFCLGIATLLAVAFVVFLLWDAFHFGTIGVLCLLFLGGGLGFAAAFRTHLRRRPRLFSAVLGELAKDSESLAVRK